MSHGFSVRTPGMPGNSALFWISSADPGLSREVGGGIVVMDVERRATKHVMHGWQFGHPSPVSAGRGDPVESASQPVDVSADSASSSFSRGTRISMSAKTRPLAEEKIGQSVFSFEQDGQNAAKLDKVSRKKPVSYLIERLCRSAMAEPESKCPEWAFRNAVQLAPVLKYPGAEPL